MSEAIQLRTERAPAETILVSASAVTAEIGGLL